MSISLAVLGILFTSAVANAACGDPTGSKSGVVAKMPYLAQSSGARGQTGNNLSIVGLWYVTYTTGGQTLYESYDEWHSDGTELENPNLPPATGSLCVGVWKKTGTRTVRLHHVGWNYDLNGNPLGTFTLDEDNTVASHGQAYKGTFDLKFFDVDGNLVQEVTGTQAATRITVN